MKCLVNKVEWCPAERCGACVKRPIVSRFIKEHKLSTLGSIVKEWAGPKADGESDIGGHAGGSLELLCRAEVALWGDILVKLNSIVSEQTSWLQPLSTQLFLFYVERWVLQIVVSSTKL